MRSQAITARTLSTTMANTNCVFGQDCPCHGLNCICDMRWTLQVESRGHLVDWGIEVDRDGGLRFFVYDSHCEQYYMCMKHFLPAWGLTEDNIYMMVALRHSKIRPVPEE